MTFEEMLDHALAMLQRRGRLTYRTCSGSFTWTMTPLAISRRPSSMPTRRSTTTRGEAWSGRGSRRTSQRALAGLVRYYGDAGVLVWCGRRCSARDGCPIAASRGYVAWTRQDWRTSGRISRSSAWPATRTAGAGLDRQRTAPWPGRHGLRQRHACHRVSTSAGRGQHPNRARAERANARA